MVICPQCNIEHEPEEEFCRKCGKFLLAFEDPSPEGEKTKVKLICSKCLLLYKKGNYCRKCGSLLMEGIPPQVMNVQSLDKKSIKRWSKEWLRVLKEEKELESCMSNLEAQCEKISSNILRSLFVGYKDRLESLSPLHQEIETELVSIRKRTSEGIHLLEKELKPLRKRLEEFQSLYKLNAITQVDFVSEKKELKKEIKLRERSLKKYRQTLSLLPVKMGGNLNSSGLSGNLLKPIFLLTSSVILLLIIAGGYFFWQKPSLSSEPTPKAVSTPPPPPLSPKSPPMITNDQEVEKIKSLFENIKQANLKKNIDLFMSCYSREFNDKEGKRLDALETWGFYNYHDLSYDLKKQTISGDTAHIRLEWQIRISKKVGGQKVDKRTLMDVTLKKEDGSWKIKESKTIS